MPQNPLFPTDDGREPENRSYALPGKGQPLQPLSAEEKAAIGANPAADLIREKLERIYANEPDPFEEEKEAEAVPHRSRHQQFMYDLSTSGKSLADIQTEWHNYYVNLPDNEKHEVWQEFYANNQPGAIPQRQEPAPQKAREVVATQHEHERNRAVVADHTPLQPEEERTPDTIRGAIRQHVKRRAEAMSTRTKHNLSSLAFGLATGLIVLFVFLFGFFNEVIIAPFIQPGRSSAAPVIVTKDSVDASTASIIIPKINVQIPVVYDVPNGDESTIENALEDGVVHYPTTKKPGEKGNAAFFGHSSNNIFNKGKYKFAFVLLHKLQKDDVFYLTYGGTVYSYKVVTKKVVEPSQVDVLYDIPGKTATATLITCDPPGTSLHRLIIVGEQVSPSPEKNKVNHGDTSSSSQLPGNGPTLWTRLWRAVF